MPRVVDRGALPAVALRRATPDDVPGLAVLVESGYRGAASRQGWTTEADLLDGTRSDADEILAIVGSSDGHMIVAANGDELVGCCQLTRSAGGVARFAMFSVRPDLQDRGVGRAILAEAERIARDEWSATEMQLQVIRQRSELIAWYERLGYRLTGELAPFPYDDPKVIAKRYDLEFAVMGKHLGKKPTGQ